MSEFLTDWVVTARWGVRPRREEDDEFIRGLGEPDAAKPARRGEHLKVIEVERETVGYVRLRKAGTSVHVEDLRLLPHWRWRGIEIELLKYLQIWTRRQGLVLARPAKGAFPDAAEIGEHVRTFTAACTGGEKKKDWGANGKTWLVRFASFIVLYVLFLRSGWFPRTTLTSDVRWLQPDRILIGLTILLMFSLAVLGPPLLQELRGRLFGGRIHADLGPAYRRLWLAGSGVCLATALALGLVLGPDYDRGGAFARLLLVPAVVFGLIALRRGQVRERGILRPDVPGLVPWDAVEAWRVDAGKLELTLARYLPGAASDLLRVPLRSRDPELVETTMTREFGPPSPVPLRKQADSSNILSLIVIFGILGPMLWGADAPRERPPGTVGFGPSENAVLTIGEENELRLFPRVWKEDAEAWESLDARCFDFPEEKIEVILETRNTAGRRISTVTAVDRHG